MIFSYKNAFFCDLFWVAETDRPLIGQHKSLVYHTGNDTKTKQKTNKQIIKQTEKLKNKQAAPWSFQLILVSIINLHCLMSRCSRIYCLKSNHVYVIHFHSRFYILQRLKSKIYDLSRFYHVGKYSKGRKLGLTNFWLAKCHCCCAHLLATKLFENRKNNLLWYRMLKSVALEKYY